MRGRVLVGGEGGAGGGCLGGGREGSKKAKGQSLRLRPHSFVRVCARVWVGGNERPESECVTFLAGEMLNWKMAELSNFVTGCLSHPLPSGGEEQLVM